MHNFKGPNTEPCGYPHIITSCYLPVASNSVLSKCIAIKYVMTLLFLEKHQSSILRTNAIPQLLKLTQSKDMRVQRNSTGAILNLTHTRKYYTYTHIGVHIQYICSIYYNKAIIIKVTYDI